MATEQEVKSIHDAWQEEGSIGRLGMRPAADKTIQDALVPGGGDWQCRAPAGCVTRSIFWHGTEVALVNPSGDLSDTTEGDIAMGMAATPVMDKALRAIYVLAGKSENLPLIAKMARAAIDYVERPAPRIPEPEEESAEAGNE